MKNNLHPSPESLFALSDGQQEASDAREMEAHLSACPECRRKVAEYRALGAAFSGPVPPAPADTLERALAQAKTSRFGVRGRLNLRSRSPETGKSDDGKRNDPSLPLAPHPVRRKWRTATGLGLALLIGGVFGLWAVRGPQKGFTVENTLTMVPTEVQSMVGYNEPVLGKEEKTEVLWENRGPVSTVDGPVRVDLHKLRLFRVTKGQYLQGHYYLYLQGTVYPSDPDQLLSTDIHLSSMPVGWWGASFPERLSSPMKPKERISGPTADGIPFEELLEPTDPDILHNLYGLSMSVRVAPRSALQHVTLYPDDPNKASVEGTYRGTEGSMRWKIRFLSRSTDKPGWMGAMSRSGDRRTKLAAKAQVEVLEERTASDPSLFIRPFLDADYPWLSPGSVDEAEMNRMKKSLVHTASPEGEWASYVNFLWLVDAAHPHELPAKLPNGGIDGNANYPPGRGIPVGLDRMELSYIPTVAWKTLIVHFPRIPLYRVTSNGTPSSFTTPNAQTEEEEMQGRLRDIDRESPALQKAIRNCDETIVHWQGLDAKNVAYTQNIKKILKGDFADLMAERKKLTDRLDR